MHHDHPTNTKAASPSPAVCGICAVAAAFLLAAALPDAASAAQITSGSLRGRNIWGCESMKPYTEIAGAFKNVGKAEGQRQLDAHIRGGVCKMLKTGAKATIKHTATRHGHSPFFRLQIEGESKEWWVDADNFKRD